MKSTFRILFYVKRDKERLDGSLPIMCRITIDGRASRFNTKISIMSELWDAKAYCAKGRSREANEINALLNDIRTSIHNVYHKLIVHENTVSAEEVKNIFLGGSVKNRTLIEAIRIYNDDIKKLIGHGKSVLTYNRYELVRKRVLCFLKEHYQLSDIPLKDVDHEFIYNFNIFVMTKYKCGVNTVGKFMQRFRSVILMAKNNEWIQTDPFVNFKIKFTKTDRGYLNQQEIDAIMKKRFSAKRLSQVRDVFIFCCYTGLSYIDVKNLTQTHIQTGFDNKLWIMSKREKTGVSFNLPLLDLPKSILDKYSQTLPEDKLLPVLSNQKMNAYLKEIGDICGIEKELTFHLARHTFATLTLTKGVSIESVSKMLGHTDIKTTQIYARVIDQKVSQDMKLFSERLDTKVTQSKSGLDLLFESLSLNKKLFLFNLPISLSKSVDIVEQISKLWYNLSESEKSSLWHNSFRNKVAEEKISIEADESENYRLKKII